MAKEYDVSAADTTEGATAVASVGEGEINQLSSGRAGVNRGTAVASGTAVSWNTTGQYTAIKTAGFVALAGGRAFWDNSASAVHYKKVGDRDYYTGRFMSDATTDAVSCTVIQNIDPPYDIDLGRDYFETVLVGTSAASGFGYPQPIGGAKRFTLTATNEAQKVDALSLDSFANNANAIVEFAFTVSNDGASGVQDFSIGVASATHASDADSIAQAILFHLDGNSTTINAESRDGTTTVARASTTITYTEGASVANRVEGWIDMRDPSSVKLYINGSRVLSASTFNVGAAGSEWKLLVHLEKSASADVYVAEVHYLRVRYAEN